MWFLQIFCQDLHKIICFCKIILRKNFIYMKVCDIICVNKIKWVLKLGKISCFCINLFLFFYFLWKPKELGDFCKKFCKMDIFSQLSCFHENRKCILFQPFCALAWFQIQKEKGEILYTDSDQSLGRYGLLILCFKATIVQFEIYTSTHI